MKSMLPTLLLIVPVLASPVARQNQPLQVSPSDFELLNLIRTFSSIELSLWNQTLANFTAKDFDQGGFPGFRKWVEVFQSQETVEFDTINQILGNNFSDCTFTIPVGSPEDFLSVAQVVTSVSEAALIGLESPDFRVGVGAVLGVEARRNSKFREEGGLFFFNGDINFDTSLTPSQAYSLAQPASSCPASNPPIPFPIIPTLDAEFTWPNANRTGDEITITWDEKSVKISGNVFISFASGFTSVEVPLKQTGKGTGTTTLPPGIKGTAFLVLTDYQGAAPIPQENNLAIGFLVVT